MMAKLEDGGFDFAKFKKLYTSKYANGDPKRQGSAKKAVKRAPFKSLAIESELDLTLGAPLARASMDNSTLKGSLKTKTSQTPAPLKGQILTLTE